MSAVLCENYIALAPHEREHVAQMLTAVHVKKVVCTNTSCTFAGCMPAKKKQKARS